jgi:hypothetical protein
MVISGLISDQAPEPPTKSKIGVVLKPWQVMDKYSKHLLDEVIAIRACKPKSLCPNIKERCIKENETVPVSLSWLL